MQKLGQIIYDIEAKTNSKGFVTYSLITKAGGRVINMLVAGNDPSSSPSIDHRHHDFIPIICKLGLGPKFEQLFKTHGLYKK